MPYTTVNDIQMYYEEAGRGSPLVLLHGGTGAIDFEGVTSWAGLMPGFAERYRAIHLEHRGHGRTRNPAGRLSFGQIAADVCAFIEQLGLAPAHVAGISDGAIIALTIGMTRPELARTLVCVGANYCNDEQTRTANAFLDAEMLERDHPDFAQLLIRVHDAHQGPGYWRTLVGQVRTLIDAEPNYTEADLRRIPTPTLLIAGETDPWAHLDQMLAMRRSIPDSEMLILNHAGMDAMDNHVVQYSRADIVSLVVLDFLARHEGAGRQRVDNQRAAAAASG